MEEDVLTVEQARALRALVSSEVGIAAVERLIDCEIQLRYPDLRADARAGKMIEAACRAAEIDTLSGVPSLIRKYADAGYRLTSV